MPIDSIAQQSVAVRKEIDFYYSDLLSHSEAARMYLDDQLMKWRQETKEALRKEFPFFVQKKVFLDWEILLQTNTVSKIEFDNAVDNFIDLCGHAGYPANESFWTGLLKPKMGVVVSEEEFVDEISISSRLLLGEWRKRIDQVCAEWELQEIERCRNELTAMLKKVLESVMVLQNQLQKLGVDTGVLLDLSKGKLSEQDIQRFIRWTKYLMEDKGVIALCEMLGKIRQIEFSGRIESVNAVCKTLTCLPDINSREEIVGIRLGRDLEHVLPAELALLADPDTALLFDLKYVESRLMCFDMQGIQNTDRHEEIEEDRYVKDCDKQGPMVICIDTSGSMNGMPETVAKAVALFLAKKARSQKRSCYLINYSTCIDTLDLGADIGMETLLHFLGMSFHGGTDVAPALDHALGVLEIDAYKNADLLIVSDFIMAGLPDKLLARIEAQRTNGNKFHSLVVGDSYMSQRLKKLFDNEWIFVPGHSQIYELVQFEHRISHS